MCWTVEDGILTGFDDAGISLAISSLICVHDFMTFVWELVDAL